MSNKENNNPTPPSYKTASMRLFDEIPPPNRPTIPSLEELINSVDKHFELFVCNRKDWDSKDYVDLIYRMRYLIDRLEDSHAN